MPRYFIYADTPVLCPTASGKAHDKFMADNKHLEGHEVDKSVYDEAMVEVTRREMREKRMSEYPPIGDQLDAIMKWAFTETEITLPAELKSLAGKCMSVKAKYPID